MVLNALGVIESWCFQRCRRALLWQLTCPYAGGSGNIELLQGFEAICRLLYFADVSGCFNTEWRPHQY